MHETNAILFPKTLCLLSHNDKPTDGVSCLVRIHPDNGIGQLVELTAQPLLIGRDSASNLELPDDSVSRRHALIEPIDGGFVVTDLGSTNGTYVNDARVESRRLNSGDRLRFGHQIFKYLAGDCVESHYHETIYKMMTTDGLTQVYNKRYLLEMLEREIHRARRTRRALSVMMIDADRFKAVNDTHGHLAGDEVLCALCRRAKSLLRRDEVLARYGGEEFTLVMSDTRLDEARIVAERLRRAVADHPIHTSQADIPITVSIGIAATCGNEPITPGELLHRADKQLYAAKQEGRNRVVSEGTVDFSASAEIE